MLFDLLLTGPNLASFNDRFASKEKVLCTPQVGESIGQTVFAASRIVLRSTKAEAIVVQVAHASQWSWTYEKYNVVARILDIVGA